MQTTEIEQALSASAAEVLETMFFTELLGGADPAAIAGPLLAGRLAFRGSLSGRFAVAVPVNTARAIAAGFLGVEEEAMSGERAGEVISELANMLCGSVLSRLETDSVFELTHPELETLAEVCQPDPEAVCRAFDLGIGTLTCCLAIQPAQ